MDAHPRRTDRETGSYVFDEDGVAHRVNDDELTVRVSPNECTPDEVEFELRWHAASQFTLRGQLVATNVSDRVWQISGKPGLRLVGKDGVEVSHSHRVSLESRIPRYVVVEPGQSASASVSWSSWDEDIESTSVIVIWPGGPKAVPTTGPTHPAQAAPQKGRFPRNRTPMLPMCTSSTWFSLDE
jgi:hypothetical protein